MHVKITMDQGDVEELDVTGLTPAQEDTFISDLAAVVNNEKNSYGNFQIRLSPSAGSTLILNSSKVLKAEISGA